MLTSKKIWKPSKFQGLPLSEYNKISLISFWIEAVVSRPIEFKKRFRGLNTSIRDILHILFFPIQFILTIFIGPIVIYFDQKHYKRLEEKDKDKIGTRTLRITFYCLDWKKTFSNDITPYSYVDY
jgi:hypothetical protein